MKLYSHSHNNFLHFSLSKWGVDIQFFFLSEKGIIFVFSVHAESIIIFSPWNRLSFLSVGKIYIHRTHFSRDVAFASMQCSTSHTNVLYIFHSKYNQEHTTIIIFGTLENPNIIFLSHFIETKNILCLMGVFRNCDSAS